MKKKVLFCHYDFTHVQLLKFVHLFQGHESEFYARKTQSIS